jgi:hypothetical protein
LLRLIALSTGDRDLAETIIQDCFLRAYKARESFRGDCSVNTWLCTIALNVMRDYQRLQKLQFWKRAGLAAVDLSDAKSELASEEPSPETRMLAGEQANRVQLALRSLSLGSGLADNVSQGTAGPDEFRTAPLWGLGQRLFFLHDGRATPSNGGLLTAIQDHASSGSEASSVIKQFEQLNSQQQQDLLDFLRSL